ncbi:hypothetical protein N7495_001375 [Penicillium taxi]|uniref:uncharacterized protein n=1 Tax=Penicillium taxi TaxID=168475 RepID=UPI0025451F45|nr:uncharacterized protein N7495_001375 [Penicillium taxi]KAJ5908693.1 hypothetical protein N7495_001375 [Penicillium taxi]
MRFLEIDLIASNRLSARFLALTVFDFSSSPVALIAPAVSSQTASRLGKLGFLPFQGRSERSSLRPPIVVICQLVLCPFLFP